MIDTEHGHQPLNDQISPEGREPLSGYSDKIQAQIAALALSLMINKVSFRGHLPQGIGPTNRQHWHNVFETNRAPYMTGWSDNFDHEHHTHEQSSDNIFTDFKLPTHEEQPEAPPPMPFEIYPHSISPTELDKASASRANEVMREQLVAQGWEGGRPTEDQFKRANREALRRLHTDVNVELSDVDLEAAKLISGQVSEIKKELFTQEHDAGDLAA